MVGTKLDVIVLGWSIGWMKFKWSAREKGERGGGKEGRSQM